MRTHNIPFSTEVKKITLNYPKSAPLGFFPRTQEQVQNSRGKRAAISAQATEGLLYSAVTVKTLNIGTPRPATIVVLNIKQFNFTMK